MESLHLLYSYKVIDLDNARAKNTEWRRGGTLIYYSPELVEEHYKNGGGVQATLESDRWAIGAMLYELITGQKLVCTLMDKGEGSDSCPDLYNSQIQRSRRQIGQMIQERSLTWVLCIQGITTKQRMQTSPLKS